MFKEPVTEAIVSLWLRPGRLARGGRGWGKGGCWSAALEEPPATEASPSA